MRSVEATWNYSLDAECPECGEYQDIYRQNAEQDNPAGYIGENPRRFNTEDDREDVVVICEKCKKEFCISNTEY